MRDGRRRRWEDGRTVRCPLVGELEGTLNAKRERHGRSQSQNKTVAAKDDERKGIRGVWTKEAMVEPRVLVDAVDWGLKWVEVNSG